MESFRKLGLFIIKTILIAGGEELLIDREINNLFNKLKKDHLDVEKYHFYINDENAWSSFLEASSPGLFGGVSLIILDNLNVAEDKINGNFVSFLKNLDPSSNNDYFLVLVHRGGTGGTGILKALKGSKISEVRADKLKRSEDFESWIRSELKQRKRKMSEEAVTLLKNAVGEDLRELSAAISQLATDVISDPITELDVLQYYQGTAEIRSYEIADAILNKKTNRALTLLYAALEQDPNSAIPIVNSISSNIRYLVKIAGAPKGMADSEIARDLAINPFRIKFLRGYIRNWSPRKLADATVELAKVDASLKAGYAGIHLDSVQKKFLLEETIRKMCLN